MTLAGFDLSLARLLLGLFTGLIYGLLAVGLVLVFRASRFINFAQGAIGVFGAAILGVLVTQFGVPYWVAFAAALLAGAGISALTEIGIIRRLASAPKVLGMVATLGLSQFLLVFALVINKEAASGINFPKPPGLPTYTVGRIDITPPYVAMIVLTPFLLLGLGFFLKRTRYGLAIRAAADNPDAASLAGVAAARMVTLSWAVAGAIAAFSACLVWPTQGTVSVESLGPSLLLAGLAGAVIGRLQSLPIAFSASLGIGIVEQVVRSKYPTGGQAELVLGAIVILALLFQKRLLRREQVTGDWARLSPEPIPTAYRKLFLVRAFPWVVGLGIYAYAAYLAFGISNFTASVLTSVVGAAIIGLSVGVVTGLAGQLSLGQYAFAGIGAVVSVVVAEQFGFLDVALVSAALAGAIVAALLGIPGLRLRGLAFAVSTLAFSIVTSTWLLKQEFMLGDGRAPGKPIIGSWELSTAKGYYLFSLAVLGIAVFLAANVRRSGLGRLARALRDNEDAARAFSVPASRRKLQVFAVAGALAGIGGAVLGHAQSSLTTNVFPAEASIDVVALSVVGGLGVLLGPILGALYIVGLPGLLQLDTLGRAAVALGWLVLIVLAPGGFGGFVVQARNRFYDLLAKMSGVDPAQARAADREGLVDRAMRGVDLAPLQASSTARPTVPVPPHASAAGAVGVLPAGSDVVLSLRGLSRAFGGVRAVRGVDLDVRRGEILGIIGPNGAGKTTLFEIVAGFTSPDEGKVYFDGVDVTRLAPEKRAQRGLVRSFQSSALFPTLTVLETVMVACEQGSATNALASLAGWWRPDRRKERRARQLLEVMGLTAIAQRPVAQLSTGTRRMVELTCMLALDPTVLLLDEPAGGLAQSEGQALVELIQAVRRDLGTTVVIVEHDLPLLFRVSDRLVAMELGAVIAAGSPEEVRNHPDVVRSYLGGDITAVERSGPLVTSSA